MTSSVSRRQALRHLVTGTAAAATAPLWVENLLALGAQHAAHRQSPKPAADAWKPKVFTADQNELVITLTELIIPETDTPGAKAAKVNEYMDMVLGGADAADREKFLEGLAWIDARSGDRFHARFVSAQPAQQVELLTAISTAAAPAPDDARGAEFFQALKGLAVTGFYTSEPGLLQDIGDDGQLFFTEFKGCDHKEHGA
jgi:glucoside 3-dehydrogenase (cytochrome c) hitch-hiker subunit